MRYLQAVGSFMSLICLKWSVKEFPRKEDRKLTSFHKFSNHVSRQLTLLLLTLINQWLYTLVKQGKKWRRQLCSGEIPMQHICSQYCWTGVYLYLKNLQTFWGWVIFLGEESRKSMQFVLQEKKKSSKKSTNYPYNPVNCLFWKWILKLPHIIKWQNSAELNWE